jgi:hypothetical protein
MKKAIYDIPFADLDYVAIARSCGIKDVSQDGRKLTVVASQDAIDTLSNNLDYGPEWIRNVAVGQ